MWKMALATFTLPETNIAPARKLTQKETRKSSKHLFSGAIREFQGG